MRICWIKAGGLVPPDFGGRIRSFQMVKELARRHQVTLVTYYPRQAGDQHPALAPLFAELVLVPLDLPQSFSMAGVRNYARLLFAQHAYSIQKYYRPELKRAVASLFERETFDAIICDFIHPAGLLESRGDTPMVLFAHNVEAEVWDRHRKVARSWIWKIAGYLEWRALARNEKRYVAAADHVVAVSARNKESFARYVHPSAISVIGTGVDSEYFSPAPEAEQPGHLVFTGAMDWAPNEDAIDWCSRDILPRIRSEYPDVVTWFVGRNPPASMRALERATKNLHVTGRVDDIRPYLRRASVYITPMRSGSGTRLKVFEAMASGKAIVSTPIGAEGLPVEHEKDILLAETPVDFARQCARLLRDPDLRRRLGGAARRLVEEKYSWARVVDDFEEIMRNVAERRRAARAAAAR